MATTERLVPIDKVIRVLEEHSGIGADFRSDKFVELFTDDGRERFRIDGGIGLVDVNQIAEDSFTQRKFEIAKAIFVCIDDKKL